MSARTIEVIAALALCVAARSAGAQAGPDTATTGVPLFVANSPNVRLLSHIPLGRS
jgi:hypothetical protein